METNTAILTLHRYNELLEKEKIADMPTRKHTVIITRAGFSLAETIVAVMTDSEKMKVLASEVKDLTEQNHDMGERILSQTKENGKIYSELAELKEMSVKEFRRYKKNKEREIKKTLRESIKNAVYGL